MTEPIAVLIATRDRPQQLTRCLDALLANDYPDFCVWVIDQSADDASADLVRALSDSRLHSQRQQLSGLTHARNAAVAAAASYADLYAFTDDDCVPAPDWLTQTAIASQRDPDAGLIYGTFRAAAHNPRTHYLPHHEPGHHRRTTSVSEIGGAGGNMTIRRSAIDEVGGFDPCLGAGATFRSGEDEDFARRIVRAGFPVTYAPDSVVVHEGARAYADGSAQQLLRGHALAYGAIFAKELRLGHRNAALAAAQLGARLLARLLKPATPAGRSLSAARCLAFARGYARGLRHPLDHHHGVFIGAQTADTGGSTHSQLERQLDD